jgi:CRP-like cAMP-binding protein
VAFANEAGGRDNVTAIVVAVEGKDADVAGLEGLKAKLRASSSVFLLEGLSLEETTRVLEICSVRSCGAGVEILRQGEMVSSLSWVLQGAVALTRDGRESRLGPGDHFGETTVLKPRRSRATARALAPTRLLTLEGEGLSALSRERPWLGVALLERLGRRLCLGLDRASEGEAAETQARGSLL